MNPTNWALILLFSLTLIACDKSTGDNSSEGVPSTSAWEGQWMVQSREIAEGNCESTPQAPEVGYFDSLALIGMESFMGTRYLELKSCPNEAACDSLLAGTRKFWMWGYQLDKGDEKAGYTGAMVSAGENFDDECEGYTKDVSLKKVGDVLVLEVRHSETVLFAHAANGFCMTNDAAKAVQGKPCVKREVIELKETP